MSTINTKASVTVRFLTAADREALHDLRIRVLRPGRPPETAHFPGDEDTATIHLGAFTGSGKCVGIASLFAAKGTQLRGMAVEPEWRGQGVGAALLREVYRLQQENKGVQNPLWCNARESAVGFYQGLGWQIEGEKFEIPDVGPHYIMRYVPETSAS